MGGQILGRDVERARRVCFLLGNIDTSDPGSVHADVRHYVTAFIGHRNIHGLSDFRSLLFRRGYYASCICQTNHRLSLLSWEFCLPDWPQQLYIRHINWSRRFDELCLHAEGLEPIVTVNIREGLKNESAHGLYRP